MLIVVHARTDRGDVHKNSDAYYGCLVLLTVYGSTYCTGRTGTPSTGDGLRLT